MTYNLRQMPNRTSTIVSLFFIASSGWLNPAMAQGLDSPNTIDTIIGENVRQKELSQAPDEKTIITAIEQVSSAVNRVRKTTALDNIEIAFLPYTVKKELSPNVEKRLKSHQKEIAELRMELEANAMLYHAIDSHSISMRDIVAVQFRDRKNIKIYAVRKTLR